MLQGEQGTAGPAAPVAQWTDAIVEQYGVQRARAARIADAAREAATAERLDPLLLLAMIAVESTFDPLARSPSGAAGLMQVVPGAHAERMHTLARDADPFAIDVNVRLGASILREYLDLCGGDRTCALQRYNGTPGDPQARYAAKVVRARTALAMAARDDAIDAAG